MDNQQEIMFKLQMFEQQIRQLQQQIQAVDQAIVEMNSLTLGLNELVGKKDKEIMASIGKGIFAKAKLISEDLIVDVGGRNFVTKSIPQTKELIEDQIQKLTDVQEDLRNNLEQLGGEFNNLIMEAQASEMKEGKK